MLGRRAAQCTTGIVALPKNRSVPSGQKLGESPEVFESDVAAACECEMAMQVSDVMYRRKGLALSRWGGPTVAEAVSHLMAARLGWSESERVRSVEAYLRERSE